MELDIDNRNEKFAAAVESLKETLEFNGLSLSEWVTKLLVDMEDMPTSIFDIDMATLYKMVNDIEGKLVIANNNFFLADSLYNLYKTQYNQKYRKELIDSSASAKRSISLNETVAQKASHEQENDMMCAEIIKNFFHEQRNNLIGQQKHVQNVFWLLKAHRGD